MGLDPWEGFDPISVFSLGLRRVVDVGAGFEGVGVDDLGDFDLLT